MCVGGESVGGEYDDTVHIACVYVSCVCVCGAEEIGVYCFGFCGFIHDRGAC